MNEYKAQITDFIFSHVDIEKAIDKPKNDRPISITLRSLKEYWYPMKNW